MAAKAPESEGSWELFEAAFTAKPGKETDVPYPSSDVEVRAIKRENRSVEPSLVRNVQHSPTSTIHSPLSNTVRSPILIKHIKKFFLTRSRFRFLSKEPHQPIPTMLKYIQ